MSERLACLSFHAERLERDDVWSALVSVLDRIERRGTRCTFFVHPFTAIRAGVDLGPRLRELGARGHEIAQHTHFYVEFDETSQGLRKRSAFDAATVAACLTRDRDYLIEAGFTPHGFVSGGWAIVPAIFEWLQSHGYVYDCSYRTFRLRYPNPQAVDGDGVPGPFRAGSLLELPTTAPLSEEVRGLGRSGWVDAGPVRYRLSYLHDDDLLDPKKAFAVTRLRPIAVRGSRPVTAGELADSIGRVVPGEAAG